MTAGAETLIGAAHRAQRWARDRPQRLDAMFVVVLFVLELIDLIARNEQDLAREPDLLAALLIGLGAAILLRRRQNPTGALVLLTALMAVFYVLDYGSFMSIVGLAGFYAVAAHAVNRRQAWIVLFGSAVSLVVVASFTLLDRPQGFLYSGAASMTTSICLAIFVGAVMRNREQIFVKAEARADLAEAERAAAAERAVTEERLRIARELHDVVAHGMSVISVQASAAQQIASSDLDRAVELMKLVETTSRESLNEMRTMLGVLRNREAAADGQSAIRGPQPSLADLDTTIAHCNDAGISTELTITGTQRPIQAGMELTVFRIVQEALTNVLKHAGRAATASVVLDYRDTSLVVKVADTGRGVIAGLAHENSGNGLLGMRERVEVYDGELTVGPNPGGGYAVAAVLPLDAATSRPRVASAETTPDEAISTGVSTAGASR